MHAIHECVTNMDTKYVLVRCSDTFIDACIRTYVYRMHAYRIPAASVSYTDSRYEKNSYTYVYT